MWSDKTSLRTDHPSWPVCTTKFSIMDDKDQKIISFPKRQNIKENQNSRKVDWMLIVTIASVLVAVMTLIVEFLVHKRSEIEFKPAVDIKIEYYEQEYFGTIKLDQAGRYINKLTVITDESNTEPVMVTVIPFYNIIYYDQKEKTLIKQILPIYDMEKISRKYSPLDIKNYNTKNGTIADIELNENTCKMFQDMMGYFEGTHEIEYKDYFYNIFGDSIIASIDFEYYVVIDYKDIYQNDYKDVYLCETGFRNFSGYLTDFMYQNNENIDTEISKYNVECVVDYAALKNEYIDNLEFDAKLSKISNNDIVFNELYDFYSTISTSPGDIIYTLNSHSDIKQLVKKEYGEKQLIFVLNQKRKKWDVCT